VSGELRAIVARDGFAHARAPQMQQLTGIERDAAWDAFAATWSDLALDTHLPDGHRYRRRRHATLSARAGSREFSVEPHQPHYQAREYNALVGGIERWFEPISPAVLGSEVFRRIIAFCLELFGPMSDRADWHIECHQFRIEARRDAVGLPTPEGVHRDGVDYVLVMLVDRVNIESGTTTVHDLAGRTLGSFTLAAALDSALVVDARVQHGVTAVRPVDPALPAYRDVLVVTLKARPRPRAAA